MIANIITAFVMGLFGAAHCLGMCGGVAAAISFGTKEDAKLAYLLYYNSGRLLSYAFFGALAGGMIAIASDFNASLFWLRVLVALMIIMLALYIGQIWNGLAFLERLGSRLWLKIVPLSKRLLPLNSPTHALPFGMLWGWLPCGMVYSALSLAALSNSAIQGFAVMLAFGLGTLPAMLFVGSAADSFKKMVNHALIRKLFAFILFSYGMYSLYGLLIQEHMTQHMH